MRTSLLHLYTLVCASMKMVSDNHKEMSRSIFGVLGKDRDAQAIHMIDYNFSISCQYCNKLHAISNVKVMDPIPKLFLFLG